MVYNFFDKNFATQVGTRIVSETALYNQEVPNELQKPMIRKLKETNILVLEVTYVVLI